MMLRALALWIIVLIPFASGDSDNASTNTCRLHLKKHAPEVNVSNLTTAVSSRVPTNPFKGDSRPHPSDPDGQDSGDGVNYDETETQQQQEGVEVPASQVAPSPDTEHIQWKIRRGEIPSRGVNLGGWLVSEHWMTPSAPMFTNLTDKLANAGEFQVLRNGGNTKKRLKDFEHHHATFIQQKDIQDIAEAGLNTVRVPVGYWIAGAEVETSGDSDMEVFPNSTVLYLDKLIKSWALRHNVAVLISIHAAKGSQNGKDHSAPSVPQKASWCKRHENIKNTIDTVEFLVKRYKNDDAFLGIGLLNEPMAPTDEKVLHKYYKDAYQVVRVVSPDCVITVMPLLHKQTANNTIGYIEKPNYLNVWVEWHPYFLWGFEGVSASDLLHKRIAHDFREKVLAWNRRLNSNKLFFGEWSLANAKQFKDPTSHEYLEFASAMVREMNEAKAGWTYWSWRIHGDASFHAYNPWSLRSVLKNNQLRKILRGNIE